jgi:hypothetical protein
LPPAVRHLIWQDHRLRGVVDLRRTRLEQLGIQVRSGLELRLPRTLTELRLLGVTGRDRLSVSAHRDGAALTLSMLLTTPQPPRVVRGLERVGALQIWNARTVRIAPLLAYRELETLSISGQPSCAIADPQHLARFPRLRRIELRHVYDLAAARFPAGRAFPALQQIEIDGLPAPAAAAVREKLRGAEGVELTLRGVRSQVWLRANLQNPLRHWADEYGAKVGATACKAWRKASATLGSLEGPAAPTARKRCLEAFIATFNQLDRTHCVDTIMREEVAEAFLELAGDVDDSVAEAWFDDWRDF